MAEQLFERGRMFWRGNPALIYGLPVGQPYQGYEDTWNDSQPAYSCPELGPSQTPPTPQRGFGKAWCSDTELRQYLGNATSQERAFNATWQEFENGFIFRTDEGITYILASPTGNWERLE
jgi:hypothetical protein